MTKTIRQGDVLLIKTTKEAITKAHKSQPRDEHGRVVLAYGETSGHAHVFRDPGVCLLYAEGATDRLITVDLEAMLLHDQGGALPVPTGEHDPVTVDKGTWIVRTQREWSGEEVLYVAD